MSKQLRESERRERHQGKLEKRNGRRAQARGGNGSTNLSNATSSITTEAKTSNLGALALAETLASKGGNDAVNQDSLARNIPGFFENLNADQVQIGTVIFVDPARVLPDDDQPRKQFDEEQQFSLAESVLEDGQEEVAHVYRLKGVKGYDWKLLNGERRLKAALLADTRFMVMIKPEPKSRKSKLLSQLRSNQNREGLPELDEAYAISEAMTEGATMAEILRNTGIKSELTVKKRLLLITLDARVQEMMSLSLPKAKRLGPGVCAEIAQLPKAEQYQFAQESFGQTIQQVRRAVRERLGKNAYEEDSSDETPIHTFTTGRKRVPDDDYRVFRALLDRSQRGFSHYFGITPDALERMFKNRSDVDRQSVLVHLENLVNNANALRQRIEKTKGRQ